MIFKEIFITPQVFDNEYLNTEKYYVLMSILDIILQKGFILSINNKDYINSINDNLDKFYSLKFKDSIKTILKELYKRGRIHFEPKIQGDKKPVNEKEWLNLANKFDSIRPLNTLFFKNDVELEDKVEKIKGLDDSVLIDKNIENLSKIYQNVISYSRKISIIDPYFLIHNKKYQKSLELICKNLGNFRSCKFSGKIEIFCRYDDRVGRGYKKPISSENLEIWKSVIKNFQHKYKHKIIINVLEEKTDGKKMHDRFLLTENFGLALTSGFDIGDRYECGFFPLSYNDTADIKKDFNINANIFNFKMKISTP